MTVNNQPVERIFLLGGSSETGLAIVEHTSTPQAAITLVGRPGARQAQAAQQLWGKGHPVTEVSYNTTMTPSETHGVLLEAKNSAEAP